MAILRFYQSPALSESAARGKMAAINGALGEEAVASVTTEYCYYVQLRGQEALDQEQRKRLVWLLTPGFKVRLAPETGLAETNGNIVVEIGPRLNFSTPSSTQSVAICQTIGLECVDRVERSTRYLIALKSGHTKLSEAAKRKMNAVRGNDKSSPTLLSSLLSSDSVQSAMFFFNSPTMAVFEIFRVTTVVDVLHDRMTEAHYVTPVTSFELPPSTHSWEEVDILTHGRPALERASAQLGLSFDNWDLDFYTDLFRNKLKRNPTTVECFDLAQSNSEHSRHWFFKGRMVVDGKEEPGSLFSLITATQDTSNDNNVIKFSDNSSEKDQKRRHCSVQQGFQEGANKHQSAVTCLQFNSKFVVTSSDDGTVKLWDLRTGEFLRNLVALESGGSGGVVWRLRASPTKLVCAVGSRNGTEETKLLVLDFDEPK
ncbi:hypothetical protein ISCGN_027134 [Ixodes scapularis]